MFSIPVAGLAKAAIVATISLHPAAAHQAHQAPDHYTVKSGDTLSSIARHEYGSATAWPALWWVNRQKVHNPEMIQVGQRLTLSSWHPHKAWLNRAAGLGFADLRRLPELIRQRGGTENDACNFAHGNFLRVLRSALP